MDKASILHSKLMSLMDSLQVQNRSGFGMTLIGNVLHVRDGATVSSVTVEPSSEKTSDASNAGASAKSPMGNGVRDVNGEGKWRLPGMLRWLSLNEFPNADEIEAFMAHTVPQVNTIDYGESVLLEAQRLTHGAREKDYGAPIDGYSRTAEMASGLLRDKLTKPITASEMAMIMVLVKLSRQINAPKRDNMVDAAGYAWVAHSCAEAEKTKEPMSAER